MNRLADLPAARDTQAFTFEGKLCTIGGTTDSKRPALDTIQVFSIGK